jgi:hypothetical protein
VYIKREKKKIFRGDAVLHADFCFYQIAGYLACQTLLMVEFISFCIESSNFTDKLVS